MIDCDDLKTGEEATPTDAAAHAVCAFKESSKTDALGSYTGTDSDGEAPQQDADDL